MTDISPKVLAGAFGAAVATVFWTIAVATFWKGTFTAEQLSALVGSTGVIVGTIMAYLVRDPGKGAVYAYSASRLSGGLMTEDRRLDGRTTLPEPEESFQPAMVVDEESRSAYIYLVPLKAVQSFWLSETAKVDLSSDGSVVGVELIELFQDAIIALSEG